MFNLSLPTSVLTIIRRCKRADLVDKLIGLSLLPEYHSNHLRILTLLHSALVHARGRSRASQQELRLLLNLLRDHPSGRNEDPAEDVFVSSVSTEGGEFRIFNGIYPGADFNLQRLLDATFSQEFPDRAALLRESTALLTLSNEIAKRCQLEINAVKPSIRLNDRWSDLPSRLTLIGQTAHFSESDLRTLRIEPADLRAFCLPTLSNLLEAPFGRTALCRFPVLAEGSGFVIPIPSAISGALRLHLAHAISLGTIPGSAVEAFHASLLARWLAIDLPLRNERPLGNLESILGDDPALPNFSQALVKFDEDKVAHLIVVDADWSSPPEFSVNEVSNATPRMEAALAAFIKTSVNKIEAELKFKRGMTLVVYDTPGWNLNIKVPDDPNPNWFCIGCNSHSLSVLLGDPDFTLLDMWKSYSEEQGLLAEGIYLDIWPDIWTRWSIWHDFDSSYWPSELDYTQFAAVSPGTDRMIDIAIRVRKLRNTHASLHPSGIWLRVERWAESLAPGEENSMPIYIEPITYALGQPRAVIETGSTVWWVALGRPPFNEEDWNFLFFLWQSSQHWLLRIAESCESHIQLSHNPVELELIPIPKEIEGAPTEIEYVKHDKFKAVKILFPEAFFVSLNNVDNVGEKILVDALIGGLLAALGVNDFEADKRRTWVEELTADPALKMMHLTFNGDAGMALDIYPGKPRFRPLQNYNRGRVERKLKQDLIQSRIISESNAPNGFREEKLVQTILHKAVSIHIERCKAALSELNRSKTLTLLCHLIEGVHRDLVDSERGALARSRFYKDAEAFQEWTLTRSAMRDSTFLTYRVIAEMAICHSREDEGRQPGLSDIDQIAAEVHELIRIAHFSDGVKYGLLSPEVGFRPDGGIHLRNDDSVVSMFDYAVAEIRELVASDIDSYPELYRDSEQSPQEVEVDSTELYDAFEAEYGITLHNAAKTVRSLQEVAVQQQSHVVSLRLSEIQQKSKALGPLSLDKELLTQFLRAFALPSRTQWDDVPAPFQMNDVWPWLFERRLSLMARPILLPTHAPDPELIFGVRQLGMAVHYVAHLLESGIWPKNKLQSSAARRFVDNEVQSRGTAFEFEIASLVQSLGWWEIHSRQMREFGASKQLGDLDVLAVSPNREIWIVIECKWFGAARTPREIANWLQDFHGHDGDKLDRHLKRYQWITSNIDGMMDKLGLARPRRVLSSIATTRPIPLAFAKALPTGTEVWTRRDLPERLNQIASIHI